MEPNFDINNNEISNAISEGDENSHIDTFDNDYTETLDPREVGITDGTAEPIDIDGDGEKDDYQIIGDFNNDGKSDTVTYKSVNLDDDEEEHGYIVEIDYGSDDTIDNKDIVYNLDSNDENPDRDDWVWQSDIDEIKTDSIVGEPEEDMENWHEQKYDDTCAVVSQEFILEELTGEEFSEEELREEAFEKGYYTPGGGTPMEKMGCLLEDYGIEVERTYDNTLEDLSEKLEQGEKVLVAVDSDEIWDPNQSGEEDLNEHGNIPGQDANHAVQVIGIDYSDPDNPVVILNDPGSPEGKGMRIPASEFMEAWEDSNYYMVSTTGSASSN